MIKHASHKHDRKDWGILAKYFYRSTECNWWFENILRNFSWCSKDIRLEKPAITVYVAYGGAKGYIMGLVGLISQK